MKIDKAKVRYLKEEPRVEVKNKNSRVSGILDGFNLTRDEVDELILEARKIWLN